ncbi:MAG TPA: hypothetical protein VGG11_12130 [Xanthobacteraceae bacterium]|jgi:hypothetical protein
MRRISSKMTFFFKRVIPVLWFGFLILFVAIPLVSSRGQIPLQLPFLIVPIAMGIFGYFLLKKTILNLVDEVWDDGDTLLIKNGGRDGRVALRDIKNLSYSTFVHPARITLAMRQPTSFGDEIGFIPPVYFTLFSKSPVINDLIERIDRARQGRPSGSVPTH